MLAKYLVVLLASGCCAAVQQPLAGPAPQSVVDAAKQKSSSTKAKRVYTNDDLTPQPSSALSAAQPRAEDQHPEQMVQPAETPAEDVKPATAHVSEAEKIVEARKIQIETMTEEKNRLEERLRQPGTSADEYSAISESIRGIDKKLGNWKKQLDDAQKIVDTAKRPKETGDAQPQ